MCHSAHADAEAPLNLYCHQYHSLEYQEQLASMGNRSDSAGALPRLDYVESSSPQLFCRGKALEVAETTKRLFPHLQIPPPTDPRCVKSLIKLNHLASEIGIDVSAFLL